METINHEYYVSLEVAKLLKETGFDWKVNFFYRDGILRSVLPDVLFNGDFEDVEYYYKHIGIPHQSLDYNDGSSKFLEEYSAPTIEVAQRWLREVKKLYIEIQRMPKCDSFDRYFTSIAIMQEPFDTELRDKDDEKIYISGKTYEEAQEAGIKKALEIILKKGE